MLDLETMGDKSYSSIVSIAAVEFDINTGDVGNYFFVKVDLQSCIDLGLNVTASTIQWWMQQSSEARENLVKDTIPIKEALLKFSDFCDYDDEIWGNSARFDLGILQNAYDKAKIPIPWNFRKERCLRTLVSFYPEIKKNWVFQGICHNALDDCYNQIGYCSTIWNKLNINTSQTI